MLKETMEDEVLRKQWKKDYGEDLGQPWSEWWGEIAANSVTDPGSHQYRSQAS
jgi:hypothetical protein